MAIIRFDMARQLWKGPLEKRLFELVSGQGLTEQMLNYHLLTGGKRLRALLPVWVCHNLGGDAGLAIDVGIGLELLHNATLVHDDIQDGDVKRRGKPTVWCEFGMPQALNAGNSMIFKALSVIASGGRYGSLSAQICDALSEVVDGQVMEFQLKADCPEEIGITPDLKRWADMARRKTGVLFGACLMAGAHVANADERVQNELYALGERMGLLFQVQDDYLDLTGDKGRHIQGSDIAEGKLSFPVLWAYENAGSELVTELKIIIDSSRSDTTIEMVERGIELLTGCGALKATANWMMFQRESILSSPISIYVPGLVEQFLTPVLHAMSRPCVIPSTSLTQAQLHAM